MELRDLRNFIAVVQSGSYTRAANQSFVSQPSLSKSIKRLEEEINIKLLERSTRYVRLTDAGRIVFDQAKKAVLALDEMPVLLNDLKQMHTGSISIGIPSLVSMLFFPELARKFHESYPHVKLDLTERGAKLIWELVDNGDVNIGFVVLPANESLFDIQPFIEDEFVLFVHKEHPLAKCEVVSLEDLKEEQFIIFSEEYSLHDLVIHACTKAGFIPTIAYKSSQWDLIVELVASRLGITLLPRSIYEKQKHNDIQKIELQEQLLWRLGIITKRDAYLSVASKEFLSFTQ
ncbi:LysR family transcriptional regulator [Solibacillus sp. R5-41]|uniref:LysR family transcriptional regulator n=1 Tax=Solibacillus sp. R5-41 TaxID=2048654 RepID=UPI000C128980|nr:LysR family transcriptional regulator [Solibacillus sp. R5-41]ATP38853.1 LysR family transcriptional regulator [Solibacillus sp. R5-41]